MSGGGAAPTVGATCFFNSPNHSWSLGTVESCDAKETFTCKTRAQDGTKGVEVETISKLKANDVFVITNQALLDENPDDLLMLTLLHDSTLMHSLNQRYFKDTIYTDIGPIVVAFNPFKFTIPWYKDDVMSNYLEEDYPIRKNKPHSWAVAHNTYFEMLDRKQNQCVLVSGESGAGKTEAVKIVMKYLSAMSIKRSPGEKKLLTEGVGRKLLQASPILEGFGNAKTVRNDNSSRFGKFMKVQFLSGGTLVGAFTIKYLLEKSRIVTAGPGERCYHAFYYVCAGDPSRYKVEKNPTVYRSLNAGKCCTVDGIDDNADFKECLEAFKICGINDKEVEEVWRVVGGVLNLLNVDFVPINGGDASDINPACLQYVQTAADVWQVNPQTLQNELLRTVREARGESFTKNHIVTAAIDARDSLVKALYDCLFDWLVNKLNSDASVDQFDNFIGLLDIFGFEDFKVNSFEQLCINLANETLQHHYNTYIFNKDIDECKAEGVDVTSIVFPDNTPCLTLITDKLGILALLDEECALGKGSDDGFLNKVIEKHSAHPFFEKDRLARTSFKVKHYAGDVSYEVANFLDKNRDTLKDEFKNLFRTPNPNFTIIPNLLPEPVDAKGKKITVGGFFKSQLGELMELINSTNPHWIRCIKPHPAKKPQMWHGVNVFTQLSSSGIIGTVKVRKAGFPIRMYFTDFLKRFKLLKPGPITDLKEKCREIVASQKLDNKRIQVGTTRVFMKNEEYNALEQAIAKAAGVYVLILQDYARHMYAKVILGEKDFEKNKKTILEGFRKTMMIQIDEKNGRKDIELDQVIKFTSMLLPELEAVALKGRTFIEQEWETTLHERADKEGRALRELEKRLAENRKKMHELFAQQRVNMLDREEKGRAELLTSEALIWTEIVSLSMREQFDRDKTREIERSNRRTIEEQEAYSYSNFMADEKDSFTYWKEREQYRLAGEWKDLIEGVYAVQAQRKAGAIAQEKFMYDHRRREMAELRRNKFKEEITPRLNTAMERRTFELKEKKERESQFQERENDADKQVESLRMRKELLIGKDGSRRKAIERIRNDQIQDEKRKRITGVDDGSKHDALACRNRPTGTRYPLHTYADPPPPYLFSQPHRSTAEEIMAARSPTPGVFSPSALIQSPSRISSPWANKTGLQRYSALGDSSEMEPLFSPVRTRAAAGLDPHGNAMTPMLPQPNPVSPPKLGSWQDR